MNVCVRRKSFTDKKDKRIVEYDEFYVSFEVCIKESEVIDVALKIEDKLARQMLKENLGTADFAIKESTKDGRTYYFPQITFNVGKNQYNVPVKMSAEALVLCRIGLVEDTTNLGF